MNTLEALLKKRLDHRAEMGLLRTLRYNDPNLIDFTSNDYLGLARSMPLAERIHERAGASQLNGATGSRLLSGNSPQHEAIEKKLADLFKSDSALLFGSGYNANLAVLSALPQRGDTILYDELSHASLKDGARLSLAKRLNFKHNDLEDLSSKLKHAQGQAFIVVESIYSMDGDQCPLAELVALADKHHAIVVLDEAHSTGVVGWDGSGLAVSLGLEDRIGVRIYTFGKAMGLHGACVAGSKALMQYIVNFSRPFIYTTAMPFQQLTAIACAFDYLKENIQLQQTLREKISLYVRAVEGLLPRTVSHSAIQTLIVPGNDNIRRVAGRLQGKGYDVRPILSPTVPAGTERLRICLHTYNTSDQILGLAGELKKLSSPE
ncbi:MAG TPA: 8-amino-7-oxononanoate synthase [Chryseolinea sp.]